MKHPWAETQKKLCSFFFSFYFSFLFSSFLFLFFFFVLFFLQREAAFKRSDICRTRLSLFGVGSGRHGRDRQLPDPSETPGQGVEQRPGLHLEAPPQPQQGPALSVREAFLGGLQQSPFLQWQEKTRSPATRSVTVDSSYCCVLCVRARTRSPSPPPPPSEQQRGIMLQSRAPLRTGPEARFSPRCQKYPPVP